MTLARAIIGQQVSTGAADAVWDKFIEAAGKRPTPVAVLRVGIDGLRQAGLSQRKAEYVLDLAAHFGERRVHPERWRTWMTKPSFRAGRHPRHRTLDGGDVLIFNLQRPDILPLDDPGLLKAISLHYFSGEPVSRFEAREVSLAWQPWRTVATWYLWRSLEPDPVQY